MQVFERTGDIAVYTRRAARTLPLGNHGEREQHEIAAGEHTRKIHVDRHGIITVSVRISELRTPVAIPVAELSPPVCEARHEPPVGSPGFEIRQSTGQDGVIRFTLYPPDHRSTDLVWRYQASNAVALTQAEVPRYNLASRRDLDGSHASVVVRSHTVRFPCRHLTLDYSFDDPVVAMDSVEKWALRCVTHNGDTHWERAPHEERRCELIKRSPTEISLAIEAPIVGHRYAIAYRPSLPGHALDYTGSRIAARLLDRCIADRELGAMLSYQLAETISAAISAVFGGSPGGISWMGLLWDDAQGRLLPAFGNFASREWVCSYPSGTGVAGHAFRFNRPAAWCRGTEHTRDALVYQRSPIYQHWQPEHDWIVCVPLVGDAHKNPLGVVQFEGGGKQHGLGDRLREFANAALAQAASKGSSWEVFQQTLSSTVNTGFWHACALADCLIDYRDEIHRLMARLELGGQNAEASLTDGSTIRL